MKTLRAKYPILYRSKQYEVGATLPADDAGMVAAWIKAGTAVWANDEEETTETKKTVKAKPAAAEAALAGSSENGETDENLVGKVPETPARTKKGVRKRGA